MNIFWNYFFTKLNMYEVIVYFFSTDLKYVVLEVNLFRPMCYRSGTVNSNTVNSKFHLIRSCCEYLARFLSFHV